MLRWARPVLHALMICCLGCVVAALPRLMGQAAVHAAADAAVVQSNKKGDRTTAASC
jgi:hypothetical protein